jgi:hypothetical protein
MRGQPFQHAFQASRRAFSLTALAILMERKLATRKRVRSSDKTGVFI